MKEIWKVVPINDGYAVSNLGRIKRIKPGQSTMTNKLLLPNRPSNGYWRVTISKKNNKTTHKIHFLVATAFLGVRPLGYEVNHRDGNKNNNAVTNLEYCTRRANVDHAVAMGLRPRGERNGAIRKLNKKDIVKIRRLAKQGIFQRKIGNKFGVSSSSIYDIIHKRTWAWV